MRAHSSPVSSLLALLAAVTLFTRLCAPATAQSVCFGDCNGDSHVTVDEILTIVNIALGTAVLAECPAGDADGSGQITVDEILLAVNNALNGCPVSTPTATPVSTPPPTSSPMTVTVMVGPDGTTTFSPSDLTIHVGDTVEWMWASSFHNVVSGTTCTADGLFCSPSDSNCALAPLLNQGSTYSHTFTAAGTFPFFCSAHCSFGMVGTITVQ